MAKYSERLAVKICALIEEGEMTIGDICKALRLSRKTFYDWKAEKPEFCEAVEMAKEEREERLLIMAKSAMKRKMEGYASIEIKTTYVPDKVDPEKMVIKQRVVKEKQHAPDTATINGVLKRAELVVEEKGNVKKSTSSVYEIKVGRPLVTEVVDEGTKLELEKLMRGERGKPLYS